MKHDLFLCDLTIEEIHALSGLLIKMRSPVQAKDGDDPDPPPDHGPGEDPPK